MNKDINLELNQSRTNALRSFADTGKVTEQGSIDANYMHKSQSSIGKLAAEGAMLGSSESEPDYNQKLSKEILHENRPKYDVQNIADIGETEIEIDQRRAEESRI